MRCQGRTANRGRTAAPAAALRPSRGGLFTEMDGAAGGWKTGGITVLSEALFQLSPNGYMVLDRHLRFLEVNHAYQLLTGMARAQLLGQALFDLFPGAEGQLTEDDQLVYVNGVLKGKLLENSTLAQQAASNSKEQFANSPDLKDALLHAIMDALDAHTTLSSQALGSERVRDGLKDIMLGPGRLYEALRATGQSSAMRAS